MAQNIYDDQKFFDEYAKMARSIEGLPAAPEWRSLRLMIGDVSQKRILDLGCGYGWFSKWAAVNAGVRTVHAVDVSQKMIERAKVSACTQPSNLTYEVADLDVFEPQQDAYDLVYSSLTFHYVHDLKRLFSKIYEALLPGGNFVFSVEHPIFTAPTSQIWQTGEQQEPVWPLNSYFREGLREYEWLGSSVQKCHRTIETYVRILIRCQFTLVDLEEFRPSDQDLETHPEWSNGRERPMFLLISARKN